MRAWGAKGIALAGVAALALVLGGGALAGEPPAPGSEVLDEIRGLIPEGDPGQFDVDEGDVIFGQLAEAVGKSTEVSDFGDGSSLTLDCGGFAWSYDEDGELLDAAYDAGDADPPVDLLDGGQAFTSSNRFKVDTNGIVVYYGFMPQTGDGPFDHDWEVVTSGISVDEGGDPNPNGKNRAAGIVDLADDLPVKFNANVDIEGELVSANLAPCTGNGHLEFIANPLTNPVAIAGIAALAGGIVGLLFNARPALTWREGP